MEYNRLSFKGNTDYIRNKRLEIENVEWINCDGLY